MRFFLAFGCFDLDLFDCGLRTNGKCVASLGYLRSALRCCAEVDLLDLDGEGIAAEIKLGYAVDARTQFAILAELNVSAAAVEKLQLVD